MRELYFFGSIILGIITALATVKVINYKQGFSTEIPKDISYDSIEIESTPEPELPEPKESEVIYEKNAFDQYRGETPPVVGTDVEPSTEIPDLGNFDFELRGLNIIGDKKVAIISATPIGRTRSSSRSSRSSRSSTPPAKSSSGEPKLYEEGEEITGTGYKVVSIESGLVKIVDASGITEALEFSLVSDNAIQRAEQAYKSELGRMKQYQNQNTFGNPVTKPPTKNPRTDTQSKPTKPIVTDDKAAREAAMKKRAEQLKEEMKRLKELRDQKKTEKKK